MKKQLSILCLVILLTLPVSLFAAGSEQKYNMAGKGNMAGMVTVGEQTVDGIRAIFKLDNVKATMAKMGMKETHHLMIYFISGKDRKTIVTGSVAVKIMGPNNVQGPALKMMGMQGHFGVDVDLDQKGSYLFTVGTDLGDGVKRKFELKYEVK